MYIYIFDQKQIRNYEPGSKRKKEEGGKKNKQKRALCWCLGLLAVLVWETAWLYWVSLALVNKLLSGMEGKGLLSVSPTSTGHSCATLWSPTVLLWRKMVTSQSPPLTGCLKPCSLFRQPSQNKEGTQLALLYSSPVPSWRLAGIQNPVS